MKTNKKFLKITLGVFSLATVITFANNNDPIKNKKEKANSEIVSVASPIELNKEYLAYVHENALPKEAKFLSSIISQYDVKQSPQFEARREFFTTIFKSNKGVAEVTYDNEGRVIAVDKRLKNVILPAQVQKIVFKGYENWIIVQNKYNVSFKQGSEVEKSYLVTIQKGNEKKLIRVNG